MIRTAAPAAAAGEGKADDAPAKETIPTTPNGGVASWSTDKITPFAPAADQRIIVKEVGKPLWEVFRSISITLLSTHMAAVFWLGFSFSRGDLGASLDRDFASPGLLGVRWDGPAGGTTFRDPVAEPRPGSRSRAYVPGPSAGGWPKVALMI